MQDDALLIGERAPALKLRSVTRSFSFKLNVGNYQSADFFQSATAELPEGCSLKQASDIAGLVHQFCKKEVLASVNEARKEKL
jgi:hypothetical protein